MSPMELKAFSHQCNGRGCQGFRVQGSVISLSLSLSVAKAKLKRMTNLINEHFVFVSQILPDILSRTCELPFAAGSFVFVCVYLQEEQQILIKKL